MNDYREVRIDITPCTIDATDVMAYLLAEAGFESFVPDEKGLTAYIRVEDYDPINVNSALADFPFAAALDISSKIVEGRDWNEEWEKNYFQPIVVGDRCVVRSSFHTDYPSTEYDIVIDPKMAFGTGHHATTSQVVEALLSLDEEGLTITDMGTGTGILSILAAMSGAKKVNAIEIDAFAYENAIENVRLNGVSEIVKVIHGDASKLIECDKAEIFLANINRNIITADMAMYIKNLADKATMILSGFYENDIPSIMEVATPLGLKEVKHTVKDNWACLILTNK